VRNAWAIISGRTNWVLARAKRARANAVVGWAERREERVWCLVETGIREIRRGKSFGGGRSIRSRRT